MFTQGKIWLVNRNGECMQVESIAGDGKRFVIVNGKKYQMQYQDYFSSHAQMDFCFVKIGNYTWYMVRSILNCFFAH